MNELEFTDYIDKWAIDASNDSLLVDQRYVALNKILYGLSTHNYPVDHASLDKLQYSFGNELNELNMAYISAFYWAAKQNISLDKKVISNIETMLMPAYLKGELKVVDTISAILLKQKQIDRVSLESYPITDIIKLVVDKKLSLLSRITYSNIIADNIKHNNALIDSISSDAINRLETSHISNSNIGLEKPLLHIFSELCKHKIALSSQLLAHIANSIDQGTEDVIWSKISIISSQITNFSSTQISPESLNILTILAQEKKIPPEIKSQCIFILRNQIETYIEHAKDLDDSLIINLSRALQNNTLNQADQLRIISLFESIALKVDTKKNMVAKSLEEILASTQVGYSYDNAVIKELSKVKDIALKGDLQVSIAEENGQVISSDLTDLLNDSSKIPNTFSDLISDADSREIIKIYLNLLEQNGINSKISLIVLEDIVLRGITLSRKTISDIEKFLDNSDTGSHFLAVNILKIMALSSSYQAERKLIEILIARIPSTFTTPEFSSKLDELGKSNGRMLVFALDALSLMPANYEFRPELFSDLPLNFYAQEILLLTLVYNSNNSYEVTKLVSLIDDWVKSQNWAENSYPSLAFLHKLALWKHEHGYSTSELNELLDMQNSGAISWHQDQTIDEIKSSWLARKLADNLPNAVIDANVVEEVQDLLGETDFRLQAQIFSKIKGFDNIEELGKLLDFINKYDIDRASVDLALKNTNTIEEFYKKLTATIIMKKIDAVLVENGGGPIHIGLNHKLAKICQGNWAAAEILELLEFFSNENSTHFNKALTVIVDYRLPPDASDATGLQVKEVFKKHIGEPEKWFATLRKIALNHHFVKDNFERSDAELLSELTELNQGNEKILELINSGEISALLEKIALHEKAGIKLWKAEDIRDWAKLNKEINVLDKLAEAMAVIKRASELAHGYTLRTIQVISTFLIYTSQQSRLIEVATGEGKSLITAAFTILKSLEGKRGDIITSSPVLAERDAESQKAFFELFGLSVDDNINNSKEDVKDKKPYENHVVYGDASSFMGDALRHDYLKLNTRGERKYDFVVIDEVDNMLIDKSSHIIRLSSTSPGFESLEQILLALWSYFRNIIPMHIYHDKVTGNYYFIEKGYEVKDGQLVLLGESNEAILISENIDEYYHKLLLSYGSKLLEEGRQKGVFFPPHLKDFVKQQIPNWVASLIKAEKMSENVHYVISEKEGERVISSLDVRNTGVVQSNLLWSNGLHQFLQIKHGLKLNAESIVSCFISNVAYLKKYEGNIYGVTGTLGRNPEKSILAETYNVDFVSIPTFKPKQFLELSAVIANSSPEWMQSIVASAVTEASLGRAVLIVAETIAKAKEIEKELLAAGLSGKNIKMYTRNDNAEKDVVNEKFNPGDVIVATNLAGRGTDLKLDPKIEENGGLHVCVTFLPANKRQGDQCYGRGGRQGNSGTGQLIIDLHQTIDQLSAAYPWFYGVTEEELIHWRDLADEERLLQDQTCERGMLDLRDELFRKFSELKDEIVSRPLSDSSLLQAKLIPLQKEMSSPISKAKSFEKIKEKYKRLLEQRNKDESPNISQLEELWKLWLHEHEADMLCHFKGKITSKGVDYNAYDQLRANMLAKFKEFRSKMLASYEDDSIMINPAYLIKRALIKSSEKDARRAAGLDDELAHAAYYAQARIVIDKDNSAKEQVVSLLIAASERIKNQIEILKSESILLNKPLGTNTTLSDLERQIIAKIGAYNKHIEQIEKNINQIKSNPDKYIRINSYTPLVNFLDDPNALSKEDVNEFYAIGMGDVFEITSYLPELDEGDWSCNVFAFFAGVVQIIAGVMVSAMSFGLASHIGAALIIEGVCDIFSSIKSAIDGKPMDFSSYFKSKGVSYAIDIITLGVLDIVGKIGLVKGPAVKIAESLEKITILSLGKVASAVGEKLSEAALLNFKEEIIESIKGSLNKLVNTDSKELQKIFASDAWDKQPSMQNKLFQEAYKIIEKYSRQLNDITQIFTGVAKKVAGHIVPGSNYAITAGEMAYNLDKISALVEEFCQRFSEKIKSLAGNIKSDNEKFQESLGRYFDSNVALEVHSIAVSYGLVSESIDYSFCEQIIPIDWGEFEKFENNIDQACRDVAKVSTSDYGPNLSFLKDNIAASLSNNMISRIQNQLFNPLLAMAEGQAGAKMYQTLQEMGVDVKNAVKDEARKSGEQVYQTTSDKPVHGLHLSNLESSDLSAKEKLELREYATALQAGKAAGIHEAGVAARALQRTIVVMVDGKEYKTWQEQMGGRNIYVNYNSQKGVWTTFAGKSMAIEFSSLYDAIACQLSGQTEKAVRDKMADYVTKYPYEALNYLHQYQTELRIKPYINFGQNYVRAKPIDTSQDSDNEVYVDAEAVKATKKPNNKQGRVKDSKIPELRQDSDKQPPYTSLQKPEEEDTVKAYSKDDKVEKKRKYFKEQHEKILKNYVSSSVKSMKKLEEDSPLLVIDLVYILHKAVKEKCVVSSKEQLYNLSPDAYEALAKVADELGSISSEMQSDFENLKNDVTGGWYNKLQEKLRQWSELYQDEVPEVVIDAIDYFAGQKNTKKH